MSYYSNQESLLLGFPESYEDAKAIAKLAEIPYASIKVHKFPDGESQITLPIDSLKSCKQVFIYRSLDNPNVKLVELLLATEGIKDIGEIKLTLIAPYLSYMRQDKAFNPGEVISQQVIGKFLASKFNAIITVDSHLHRISKLSQAIPTEYSLNLTAAKPMAAFLRHKIDAPFLLGPDAEALQWVEAIALNDNLDYAVATKQRIGDKDVIVTLPKANYKDRNIVLVDDVASSGQTLIQAAKKLKKYKPTSISVMVTHAFFKDGSIQKLQAEGVNNIWSCNSISHPTNAVPLTSLLAQSLKCLPQR